MIFDRKDVAAIAAKIKAFIESEGFQVVKNKSLYGTDIMKITIELKEGKSAAEKKIAAALTILPGIKFRHGHSDYEVTAHNPRRWKFPWVAKRIPDGKRFKFTEEGIRSGLISK